MSRNAFLWDLFNNSIQSSSSAVHSRMTSQCIRALCKKNDLYLSPALNEVLYLHFMGFNEIACLEDYTQLRCLWLDSNAITQIQGLDNQRDLKCLFLQNNLIRVSCLVIIQLILLWLLLLQFLV